MISSYSSLLHRLLNVNLHGGIKFGLDNSLRLNNALGKPTLRFPAIHVAGTNGKGSVTTKIATSLQAAGLRVGLYTSPHIACFRERIRINGQMITENQVQQHLVKIFNLAEQHHIPATFFELTTLMAFAHFAREKIDIAVIETGLGGRLDATNIVRSSLSVITSISLEHTELLGNTIEEIATEKGGIIKPGIPVVIGPRVPKNIIGSIATHLNSPCIAVQGSFPTFHSENEAIAQKALELLEINPSAMAIGLKALPPCRLETLLAKQLPPQTFGTQLPEVVILDVAHNPDGLKHLLHAIKLNFPQRPLRFVLGLSKNKDLISCLNVLKDSVNHFHLVEASNGRAAPKELLQQRLLLLDVPSYTITCESDISSAVISAVKHAGACGEIPVICGTFFIMAAARAALGICEPQDPDDMNERCF